MTQIVSSMPQPLGITPTEEETFSKSGATNLNITKADSHSNEFNVYCPRHRGARKQQQQQLLVRCISVDGANCPACREILKERRDEIEEHERQENSNLLRDVQLELNVSGDVADSEDELDGVTNTTSFCTNCRKHRTKLLVIFGAILALAVVIVCIFMFTGDKDGGPHFDHERGRGHNITGQTTDPSIYVAFNCTTIDFALDKVRVQKDTMFTNGDYILPWILQKGTKNNYVLYDTENRKMTVLYQGKYYINTHVHVDAHSWISVKDMDKTFNALFCLHISEENPICKKTVVMSKLILSISISIPRYLNKGQQLHTTITVSHKNIVLELSDDYDRFQITPLLC